MSSTLRPADGARRRGFVGAAPALLICVIVAVGLFEALWFGVVTDTGLAVADPAVVSWVVARRGPGLLVAARVVTDAGAPAVTVTLAVVAVVWSLWRSRRRAAVLGLVGLALLITVDVGMKALVARPRPPLAWRALTAQGASFPSGHALLSAGVLLLLAWLIHRHDLVRVGRRTGIVFSGAAGCFVVAVGASRIVLGVHFPSDVLAGWALAVFVVAALALADLGWTRRAPVR